jgi:hypothetical protein
MIRVNTGRKIAMDKGNEMIMSATERGKSLGIVKNKLVFREERLDIGMNSRGGDLNCLNGMELGNNERMIFLSSFSIWWELMISKEPVVMPWN